MMTWILGLVVAVSTAAAALSSKCVDIPSSMVLCLGVGYRQMRVPNLLLHESVAEAEREAVAWLPLLHARCAADTQRFLCSLLAPVCLDAAATDAAAAATATVIQPCQSLCLAVRAGCEQRMRAYGYPWPAIFACDNFPLDNDMCIAPSHHTHMHTHATAPTSQLKDGQCRVCNQAQTYENILDNFCRTDFALRAKLKRIKRLHLACKKAKVLKGDKRSISSAKLKRTLLILESAADDVCCKDVWAKSNRRQMFLIMGVYKDLDRDPTTLTPTFIMPWLGKQSLAFKRAVGMFNRLNCTD